jgi:hypothetical protein
VRINDLRQAKDRRPFKPFEIHLADGREIRISAKGPVIEMGTAYERVGEVVRDLEARGLDRVGAEDLAALREAVRRFGRARHRLLKVCRKTLHRPRQSAGKLAARDKLLRDAQEFEGHVRGLVLGMGARLGVDLVDLADDICR